MSNEERAAYMWQIHGLKAEILELEAELAALTAQEAELKMNCDDVAEILLSIGWDSPNDAQWTRLKDALPDLFAAIRGEEGK